MRLDRNPSDSLLTRTSEEGEFSIPFSTFDSKPIRPLKENGHGPSCGISHPLSSVRRILLVDDNESIHRDFHKIFNSYATARFGLSMVEAALFGERVAKNSEALSESDINGQTHLPLEFQIDSALQGEEGLNRIKSARAENRAYSMAFVDVRMPPGWDGIETIAQIWKVDPDIQVVICTAYSDYSWAEIIEKLGYSDRLVILKKPFDNIEVLQLASALTEKWKLLQENNAKMQELEKQYRHSQKMEAIGLLTDGLAHDFNNVLSIINGYSELLLDRMDAGSKEAEMLKEIYAASARAGRLTQQLMSFSRTRSVHFESLDLNQIVADVTKMLRHLIGEDMQLKIKGSEKQPLVLADKGMLEQVLVNLAVNARDAMPKGGTLTIATEIVTVDTASARSSADARPGVFVCLSIKDTGYGIPREILTHIFEPFFTTKENGKGTGLGLAMVCGIVQQHEGWVEVESIADVGTTFKVFLPPAVTAIENKVCLLPTSAVGGKETILLVEDEANVRSMTMLVLEKYGYRVLDAASGEEALQVWKRHSQRIDLLLTDMVMRDLAGHDLAKLLQTEKPSLKVIYTSGYSADMAGKAFDLNEMDSFVQKPCRPRELAVAVRAALDGKTLKHHPAGALV